MARRQHGPACIARQGRVPMQLRLRKALLQHRELRLQRGRSARAAAARAARPLAGTQMPAPAAATPQSKLLHVDGLAAAVAIVALQHDLRPIRVPESEHRGLREHIGAPQARRMQGIAFDLHRPPLARADQHAMREAVAHEARRVVQRLAAVAGLGHAHEGMRLARVRPACSRALASAIEAAISDRAWRRVTPPACPASCDAPSTARSR